MDSRITRLLNLPDPFKVFRCPRCGLRWLNPAPTQEEYYDLYDVAYFSASSTQGNTLEWMRQFPRVGDYENEEADARQPWYRARLARLRQLQPEAQTILDIGAATGEFLAIASQTGWTARGLEMSAYACQKAYERWGLDLIQTDLDNYDAKGQTFDVVHLSHVFEHFVDPVLALAHLKALMTPTSLLVIEIPNQFRGLRENLVYMLKRIDRLPRNLFSIHHPYFYGVPQITRLFGQHGFTVLNVQTYFEERWNGPTLKHRIIRGLEYAADVIAKSGENIEVIAKLK